MVEKVSPFHVSLTTEGQTLSFLVLFLGILWQELFLEGNLARFLAFNVFESEIDSFIHFVELIP